MPSLPVTRGCGEALRECYQATNWLLEIRWCQSSVLQTLLYNVLEVSKHRTEKEGSMALLEALNSERNPWPFVEFVASRDRNGRRL